MGIGGLAYGWEETEVSTPVTANPIVTQKWFYYICMQT